jgi:hypothetical protein
MLLFQRLPMCKCEHWPRSWGSISAPATATATHPHRLHTHIQIHIPASLKCRQRRVDLQHRTQVPRACSADVVDPNATHVQV